MHCLPPAHIVRASLEPPFPANPAAKSVSGMIARLTRDEMSRALLRQAQILKTHATRYSGSPQTFSRPSDLSLSSRIGFELFEYRPRASMQPSFLLTSCDSKVSGTQALTRTINVAWPIGIKIDFGGPVHLRLDLVKARFFGNRRAHSVPLPMLHKKQGVRHFF